MIDERFVLLGALFNLMGTTTYLVATLRGKARPNRVTWSLWAFAPLIAFVAELGEGVGLRSLMTFMAGFSPLLILLATFVGRSSYWKVTRFDYVCGALSLGALVLWGLTRQGNLAIGLAIAADLLAAVPTLRKAILEPSTESPFVFVGGLSNASIALLTIDRWTFAHYAFPAYIAALCVALIAIVGIPRADRMPLSQSASTTTTAV